jgi:hypothetical protein
MFKDFLDEVIGRLLSREDLVDLGVSLDPNLDAVAAAGQFLGRSSRAWLGRTRTAQICTWNDFLMP